LIATTRSNCSPGSSAASVWGTMIPALLNAMSRRPNASTVAATASATCCSSVTSHARAIAWWPCAVSPAVTCATWSALMSSNATAAPAAAYAWAAASPMPEPAPVTSATWSVKS
jgi:hypothetical protein